MQQIFAVVFTVFCVLFNAGKVQRSQCSLQADINSYTVATDEQVWIRPYESRWFINQTSVSFRCYVHFCTFVIIWYLLGVVIVLVCF